jgi:hypothetical protein
MKHENYMECGDKYCVISQCIGDSCVEQKKIQKTQMMFWLTQSTNSTKDGAKDSQNSKQNLEMRKNLGDGRFGS